MTPVHVRALLAAAAMSWPAVAAAQVPVGTRVGGPAVPSGYDDGGRRDPFVSLVAKRGPGTTPVTPAAGLAGLPVTDAVVRGVIKAGTYFIATIEAPDRRSYSAKTGDRFLDAVIKTVDADGIVVLMQAEGLGKPVEVRKSLRRAAEVIR